MYIVIGLLIIAIGAFCQSSSYVPINKIKSWSWESYWLIQGIFAWLIFPFFGALLAVPAGHSLLEVYTTNPTATLWSIFWCTLGRRRINFRSFHALSRRGFRAVYRFRNLCRPRYHFNPIFTGKSGDLTAPVIIGVIVTLIGIAIIGYAGSLKSASLSDEEKRKQLKISILRKVF